MHIAKGACDPARHLRPYLPFPDARSAFAAYLRALALGPGDSVLLPAYVGWSPREGSGVLDPVRALGIPFDFYRVDGRLGVDVGDFAARLEAGRVRVAVLIHYFGRVDPAAEELAALARERGVRVVEDQAHSWLSDLFGARAGRMGDAVLVSLHKLLPTPGGGLLVLNGDGDGVLERLEGAGGAVDPWRYDLAAIAARRRDNAAFLAERLRPLAGRLDPLWEEGFGADVPQSFPVLVRGASRDALYHAANARGFGVVSLYHTLVDAIPAQRFPEAHALSRVVLNLPVHQDTGPAALEELVRFLDEHLRAAAP